MFAKSDEILAGDTIIWNTTIGIAYGEVQEVVGKTVKEDDLGEYEVLILRGIFSTKEGNDVMYDMPIGHELVILRD